MRDGSCVILGCVAHDAFDVTRRQALSFRAAGHGLAVRRPHDELVEAVRPVGLRRTKNAARSLAARVEDVTDDDVTDALDDGRLVTFYGPRGTVVLAPPADVPLLTAGAAPDGEASLRAALPGAFVRRLDQAGMTATDALAAVVGAVRRVLASGPLPRGETAMAVTRLLPEALTPPCRGRCPDRHVEDSLFRLTGVRFHRSGDVLAAPLDPGPGRPWRTELVRRYLSCYGPSTPKALAAWAGIGRADARASLDELDWEVTDAFVDGKKAGVLLTSDSGRLAAAEVKGVRFLPPYDPFLEDRDRSLLVPSRQAQKAVWRAAGNPGVVLADGEPVAIWRGDKVTPFEDL